MHGIQHIYSRKIMIIAKVYSSLSYNWNCDNYNVSKAIGSTQIAINGWYKPSEYEWSIALLTLSIMWSHLVKLW